MAKQDELTEFVRGIAFTTIVTDMILHPRGTIKLINAVKFGLYYQEDWEHYASRFMD